MTRARRPDSFGKRMGEGWDSTQGARRARAVRRKLLPFLALPLALIMAGPASGLPGGPDGDTAGTGNFQIIISENLNDEHPPPAPADVYSVTQFNIADGWDFGDRYGYVCAWAEFFQAGSELFEVHYELRDDYPFDVIINDRYGLEADDGGGSGLCGTGVGKGSVPTADGTDHFPHGTTFTFFQNDQQIAMIDYGLQDPNMCDKAYWVPGDQPGEAWLWWDEDGPQEHGPGMPLDCGGGPVEPVPVVRAHVQNVAPSIGFCTADELDGSMCQGPTPTHDTTVSLRLRRNGRATGSVGVPDATAGCMASREVVLQRRMSGMWMDVRHAEAGSDGRYALHVNARAGRYRSWVPEQRLEDGDICLAAGSRRVRLRAG